MLSERPKATEVSPSTVAAVRSELRELLRAFRKGSEEAANTLVSVERRIFFNASG